jgi:ornithine cyclodeaminase/alanine dehydrogenase-like protein (mu-crystallin family)
MSNARSLSDQFLALSDADMIGLDIPVATIVAAIETAIKQKANGDILAAPKSALLRGDGRYMMTTLATGDDPDLTIVKSVMVSPRNPDRGRPGVDGAILIQDSETGQLLAVLQAGWITAMRTAGLSGVAARRLANPQSASLALIGAGVQARSHLETFAALFALREITVFGRGQANIDHLCAMARDLGLEARVCDTARATVDGADLIVSSLSLSHDIEPFVDARWLKRGAFAAMPDQALAWLPDSMNAFATIHIEDNAQERASPKKLAPPDLVTGDLQELVCGASPAGFSAASRSAFMFRGIAVGDFALARLVWQKASRLKATGITW